MMIQKQIDLIPREGTIEQVQEAVEEILNEAHVPFAAAMKIHIVVDEIYSNIVRCSGAREVRVTCGYDGGHILLEFMDDGIPFNPLETEDPDTTLQAWERDAGGLGILICRKIMDRIEYRYEKNRNILMLMKEIAEERAEERRGEGDDKSH